MRIPRSFVSPAEWDGAGLWFVHPLLTGNGVSIFVVLTWGTGCVSGEGWPWRGPRPIWPGWIQGMQMVLNEIISMLLTGDNWVVLDWSDAPCTWGVPGWPLGS
jgi:hypothetical protein